MNSNKEQPTLPEMLVRVAELMQEYADIYEQMVAQQMEELHNAIKPR